MRIRGVFLRSKYASFLIFLMALYGCGPGLQTDKFNNAAGEAEAALSPPESIICSGQSFMGIDGSAPCTFAEIAGSNAHRDVGTTQLTQKQEAENGLNADYRYIPDVAKDDDGFWTTGEFIGIIPTQTRQTSGVYGSNGCWPQHPGAANICSANAYHTDRPSHDCGTDGTIDDRIANCTSENGDSALWSGAAKGQHGEGTWKLVTRLSSETYAGETRDYEVWRDERTKLLWSDRLGDLSALSTWCQASGNTQNTVENSGNFDVVSGVNCSSNGLSLCYDDGASGPLDTPNGSGATSNYVRAKGNILNHNWRLPSKNDAMQAEVNGMRFVLPNYTRFNTSSNIFTPTVFWLSTVNSSDRATVWTFSGSSGAFSNTTNRSGTNAVRCVGN